MYTGSTHVLDLLDPCLSMHMFDCTNGMCSSERPHTCIGSYTV